MTRANRRSGLSLVEVLVAVAIAAVAVVAVVGLYGPSVVATREVADRRAASDLLRRVEGELRRGGFAAVATATASGPLRLVGRPDGSAAVLLADVDNHPERGEPPGIPVEERHFAVEVIRAPHPETGDAVLVLEVRLSWPYVDRATGVVTPVEQRSSLVAHLALSR